MLVERFDPQTKTFVLFIYEGNMSRARSSVSSTLKRRRWERCGKQKSIESDEKRYRLPPRSCRSSPSSGSRLLFFPRNGVNTGKPASSFKESQAFQRCCEQGSFLMRKLFEQRPYPPPALPTVPVLACEWPSMPAYISERKSENPASCRY